MRKLDHEIYKQTTHDKSLDDVVRHLTAAKQKVKLERFREAVTKVMGKPAETLTDDELGLSADAEISSR
jgi:predicted metalloprotease with PDZ domain